MTPSLQSDLFLEVLSQGIVADDAFFGIGQDEEFLEPDLHVADGVLLLLVPRHVLLVSLRRRKDGLEGMRRERGKNVENIGERVRLGDALHDVGLRVLGEENQHREDQLVLLHREGRLVSVGVLVHGGAQLCVSNFTTQRANLVATSIHRLANQLLLRLFALLLRVRHTQTNPVRSERFPRSASAPCADAIRTPFSV